MHVQLPWCTAALCQTTQSAAYASRVHDMRDGTLPKECTCSRIGVQQYPTSNAASSDVSSRRDYLALIIDGTWHRLGGVGTLLTCARLEVASTPSTTSRRGGHAVLLHVCCLRGTGCSVLRVGVFCSTFIGGCLCGAMFHFLCSTIRLRHIVASVSAYEHGCCFKQSVCLAPIPACFYQVLLPTTAFLLEPE